MARKIRIGIIGCGTIGSELAKAIEKKFAQQARLFALCDQKKDKVRALKAKLRSRPKALSADKLIKNCDLVIEAASAPAAYPLAKTALSQNKDIMIMSIGGILNQAKELFKLAKRKGSRIYLPSGAIGGLDAVKAAAMAKIKKCTLITRKPPQGLIGAPYLKKRRIDLSKIKREKVVFYGPAKLAIRGFPKNVNVCAALSLAGIGLNKTMVKIITSPSYKKNIHEVEVEGDFGRLVSRTENVPSPGNPKTSYLACLSAVATLKNILDVVKIGT